MGYRDDIDALDARRAALRDALAEKGEEVRELVEELEAVSHRLHRRRLQVLSSARVASPCGASWDAMVGDDRVRRCARCDKNVYDVASLTAEEVLALFEREGERPCVRLFRRRDGTVLTADCPVGSHDRNVRGALLAVGITVAGAALAAAAPWDEPVPQPVVREWMGSLLIMGEPDFDSPNRLDEDAFFGRPPRTVVPDESADLETASPLPGTERQR